MELMEINGINAKLTEIMKNEWKYWKINGIYGK